MVEKAHYVFLSCASTASNTTMLMKTNAGIIGRPPPSLPWHGGCRENRKKRKRDAAFHHNKDPASGNEEKGKREQKK